MNERIKVLAYISAGLAAPFLWPSVETYILSWLPLASSKLMWRATQILVGFASAVLLVGPLVLAIRPNSPRHGILFIGAFLLFEFVVIEGVENIALPFQLPDTWMFLVASLAFIWWASSRAAHANDA